MPPPEHGLRINKRIINWNSHKACLTLAMAARIHNYTAYTTQSERKTHRHRRKKTAFSHHSMHEIAARLSKAASIRNQLQCDRLAMRVVQSAFSAARLPWAGHHFNLHEKHMRLPSQLYGAIFIAFPIRNKMKRNINRIGCAMPPKCTWLWPAALTISVARMPKIDFQFQISKRNDSLPIYSGHRESEQCHTYFERKRPNRLKGIWFGGHAQRRHQLRTISSRIYLPYRM